MTTTTHEAPEYRALDMLTGDHAPRVGKRLPYWRPRAPRCTPMIHTPQWTWEHITRTAPGTQLAHLDTIAAYLSAASSASFAHGALEHTRTDFAKGATGYFLITCSHWSDLSGFPSPLGTQELPERVWVAHPTFWLLHDLQEAGIGTMDVHDTFTADVSCRLRRWTSRIRDDRGYALRCMQATEAPTEERAQAEATYEAIKLGYSQAVQMWLKGEKSKIHRPDWFHTVHAQHAATKWRRMWAIAQRHSILPAAVSSVDEITYRSADLRELLHAEAGWERPSLTIDPTGTQLGAYRIKSVTEVPPNA